MSIFDAQSEHPSTYVVQDRSSEDELQRLQSQDRLITIGMGGLLPELPDTTILRRVLDVGSGTGGWVIDLAQANPQMTLLIGVDISERMVNYARTQAEVQGLNGRVEFHVMDALRMLEFPNNYFDLVNERSAMSYLRTWDWPKYIQELQRVTRPGGIIRLSEGNIVPETTSAALASLLELVVQAFYQAGHLFNPQSDGVTSELPRLLKQYGNLQHVQVDPHPTSVQHSDEQNSLVYEDMKLLFRTIQPFLQKWIKVPDNYQELYQQMLVDLASPDFKARNPMLTVWGMKRK